MSVRQYIGARYVPMFFENSATGDSTWAANTAYEPLTIVTYNGNSYTSKKTVPSGVGDPSANPEYWASTGMYNAQVEALRTQVEGISSDIEDINGYIDANLFYNNMNANIGWIGSYANPTTGLLNGAFCTNNIWYQYYSSTGDTGWLVPIDMTTGVISSPVSCRAYHGNDFAVIGNTVYCAPYDDNNSTGLGKLIIFDINSPASSVEIDLTGTGYNCLYGVAVLDSSTLILAMRTYGVNNVNASHFFKYDITTGTYEEYSVDWGGYDYTVNSFPHPINVVDDTLLLSASYSNGLYSFKINGMNLDVKGYVSIPAYNMYGSSITELEGVAVVDRFGKNVLVVSSASQSDVCMFGVAINGSLRENLIDGTVWSPVLPNVCIYNSTYTGLFETGSTTYPFKKMVRAINACALKRFVTIKMESDCPEGISAYLTNFNVDVNGHTITGEVVLTHCDVIFFGSGMTFAGNFTLNYGSRVYLVNPTFTSGKTINVNFGSEFTDVTGVHPCRIAVSSGKVYLSSSDPTETLNINLVNNSLLQLNRSSTTGITFGGGTTILTPGVK